MGQNRPPSTPPLPNVMGSDYAGTCHLVNACLCVRTFVLWSDDLVRVITLSFFFFKILFIYFLDRGERKEKDRERNITV